MYIRIIIGELSEFRLKNFTSSAILFSIRHLLAYSSTQVSIGKSKLLVTRNVGFSLPWSLIIISLTAAPSFRRWMVCSNTLNLLYFRLGISNLISFHSSGGIEKAFSINLAPRLPKCHKHDVIIIELL